MSNRKFKFKMPKRPCSFTEEIWGPHPGCAEFMTGPDAYFECPSPATHRIKFQGGGPSGFGQDMEACKRHADDASGSDVKIYRFRRVAGGAK